MPYKRKYKRRYKRRGTAMATAKKALNAVTTLKANVEKKYNVVSSGGAVGSAGGAVEIWQPFAIGEGDSSLNRTGLKLKPEYIQMRMQLFWNASSTAVSQTVRVSLVIDRQWDGTNPSDMQDIYDNDPMIGYQRRLGPPVKYQVIYDKILNLNEQTPVRNLTVFKRFPKRFVTRYGGTLATTCNHNPCYLLVETDQTTNRPTYNLEGRMRFTDL